MPEEITFRGYVVEETIDLGYDSERVSVMLHVNEKKLILNILGENNSSDLYNLVGKKIEANGIVHNGLFTIEAWKVIK